MNKPEVIRFVRAVAAGVVIGTTASYGSDQVIHVTGIPQLLGVVGAIVGVNVWDRYVEMRKVPLCTRPNHQCETPGAGPCNGLPHDSK